MPRHRVALLIPYYDNPQGLRRSLESVGSGEPCDVVVVDDGSPTHPVGDAAVRADWHGSGEVTVLRLDTNEGIEGALNTGLRWIVSEGYEYVARLDCGDRNRPHRIARELEFLDSHPDVVLVGTQASYVDLTGTEQFVLPLPAEHDESVAYLKKNSAFPS